jgi:hypothetical protein
MRFCWGEMFAAEVRYRAADDGSHLLPTGHSVKRGNAAKPTIACIIEEFPRRAWQEWRDSNPQPPVLETGALAN